MTKPVHILHQILRCTENESYINPEETVKIFHHWRNVIKSTSYESCHKSIRLSVMSPHQWPTLIPETPVSLKQTWVRSITFSRDWNPFNEDTRSQRNRQFVPPLITTEHSNKVSNLLNKIYIVHLFTDCTIPEVRDRSWSSYSLSPFFLCSRFFGGVSDNGTSPYLLLIDYKQSGQVQSCQHFVSSHEEF